MSNDSTDRKPEEIELTLEDLATIVCDGQIEGGLQRRLAGMIRQDPRFAEQLKRLEAFTADAGGDDLWDGLKRNQEFDRLLEVQHWKRPEEILNPVWSDLYEVSNHKLLAVAAARVARAEDPKPILEVRDRLRRAEKEPAKKAEDAVAKALRNLSQESAQHSACGNCREERKNPMHRNTSMLLTLVSPRHPHRGAGCGPARRPA